MNNRGSLKGFLCPRTNPTRLILFPDPAQTRRSCMLYNPQEEENVYTIQDLGVDPCLASCGTWLLMSDPRLNLYLVNVLNLERINLLAIESQRDQLFSKPLGFYKYCAGRHFASKAEMIGYPATDKAVVWIDEKTKDYVVACSWGANRHTAFCKKGDCEWRQIPPLLGCSDIVLKGHKLYIYYEDGRIGIWDLKFLTKTAQVQLYPGPQLSLPLGKFMAPWIISARLY